MLRSLLAPRGIRLEIAPVLCKRFCGWVLLLAWGGLSAAAAAQEVAADDATTEFGIALTPLQVVDSMLELEGFWPPVRKYICSSRFEVASPEIRRQAVECLKQLDDRLTDRLFDEDDAVGADLFAYTAARLRKFEYFRRLRAAVAGDLQFLRLKRCWDQQLHEMYTLPAAERAARLQTNVAGMREHMQQEGLPAAQIEACMPLWDTLAQCTARVDATETGQVVVAFEQEVETSAPAACRMAFSIIDAAEWAQIIKPAEKNLSRQHFLAAWKDLAPFHADLVRQE